MTEPKPIPHGTHNGYANHGCRCRECTAAETAYARARRAARRSALREVDGRMTATWVTNHGIWSTYPNHGCRCRPCTDAAARNSRDAYSRSPR